MLGMLFQMYSSTVMGHPGKVFVSVGALVREKDYGGVSAERWMLPRGLHMLCSVSCNAESMDNAMTKTQQLSAIDVSKS